MKILFIGDIYGRSGRDALKDHLPELRNRYKPDLIIANADNASHGNGPNPSTTKELYNLGIDLVTGGDHIWDQRETWPHLDREPFVLRPYNYPDGLPGKGFHILKTPQGQSVLVIHLLGRVFIDKPCDNPFLALEKLLQKYKLNRDVDAIVVDFHAEATSEKNALAFMFDGQVSAVLGTHTHIPTHDARLLPKGTAFQTDLGMTGDYNSIIGADTIIPLGYFRTGLKTDRFKPAEGPGSVCGAIVEIYDDTGLAETIMPIKIGGVFSN